MPVRPKGLNRYLQKRQFSGPWSLEPAPERLFDACIVIPALAESATLPATLASVAMNSRTHLSRTLIVVVINNRADAHHLDRLDNRALLMRLRQGAFPDLNLAWVDATSRGRELPPGEGVGLARKIGFDLSLSHLNWGAAPFLISLDADTLVHPDYLQALFAHFASATEGAAVIPFRHQAGETAEQERAIRHYELYLRSYSYGLELSRSPYAYNSIGSAFACSANAYILAGGMNRRQAGEDFYFLQQLAKTSGVGRVPGALVYPSSRPSLRVPFGTGRTVHSQVEDGKTSFTFCHRPAFQILKDWLALATTEWRKSGPDLLSEAARIDRKLENFLQRLQFCERWTQLQSHHRQEKNFLLGFHGWFDGLRTRQLLTHLRSAEEYPEHASINDLLSWGGHESTATFTAQLSLLERLQGVCTEYY